MRALPHVTLREACSVNESTPAPHPYFELRVGTLYVKADYFPTKAITLAVGLISALATWFFLGQ
jgi:hypothetical protein